MNSGQNIHRFDFVNSLQSPNNEFVTHFFISKTQLHTFERFRLFREWFYFLDCLMKFQYFISAMGGSLPDEFFSAFRTPMF